MLRWTKWIATVIWLASTAMIVSSCIVPIPWNRTATGYDELSFGSISRTHGDVAVELFPVWPIVLSTTALTTMLWCLDLRENTDRRPA